MTEQPIRVSWSMLRVHEECKRKSHLIRTGHRSPASNIRSFYHGMVVDKVMRDWLADRDRRDGQMVSMVDTAIDAVEREAIAGGDGVVRWRFDGDRQELRRFCLQLVVQLEPILVDRVLPYRFDSGLRFTAPVRVPAIPGLPAVLVHLSGEMDLLVHRPDGRVIWDLKGTADDQYWRKVVGQLVFYDIASQVLYGDPAVLTGLIQPMCKEPVLEFAITDDDRRAMWGRILRMVADIVHQNHACKESAEGCGWCEVRHACPRFGAADGTRTGSLGMALRAARTGDAA